MVRFTDRGWSWETCLKLKCLKLGFMVGNSDENSLKSYNRTQQKHDLTLTDSESTLKRSSSNFIL